MKSFPIVNFADDYNKKPLDLDTSDSEIWDQSTIVATITGLCALTQMIRTK